MQTTPQGWFLAISVLLTVAGLKLLYLHLQARRKRKQNKILHQFEQQLKDTNAVDDLIELHAKTKDPVMKSMVEKKLYKITH
jgi:type VI protein secretion system component VasK